MGLISGYVHDLSGNAIVGASVYVYAVDTTTVISLYSDRSLSTPTANPLTTGADGTYQAYAADGRVDLKITAVGHPDLTIPDVPVVDPTLYVFLAGRSGGTTVNGSSLAGESLILRGTSNATPGAVEVRDSAFVFNENGADVDARFEGDTLSHMLFLDASAATENMALLAGAAPNWQTMDRGLFLGDASTVPTGNPSSGVFAYSESGALKWRNSGGNIVYPDYGRYTPTLTMVANLTAVNAFVCQWLRVGSTVTVSGRFEADPVTANVSTQVGISLPVASNLGLVGDLGGSGAVDGAVDTRALVIQADVANDRAAIIWYPSDGAFRNHQFTFTYAVL